MKKLLSIGLIITIPLLLSAQQKGNTQQDLQKQIEEMKKEMQSQIAALRDSITMLQQQLHSERKNSGYEFFYQNPMSEQNQEDWMKVDSLLHNNGNTWSWSYSYPKVAPYNYQFMVPSEKYKDDLKKSEDELKKSLNERNWELWTNPPCPESSKQKHKHEWMKGLPFYHLFNN